LAKPYRRKGSRFWWLAPTIAGKQAPQSSGETDYDRAFRKLKILEGKIASNAPITPRTDRDSFNALLEVVKTDYAIKGRATKNDIVRWIKLHVAPHLGDWPTAKITSAVISDYILARQNEGSSNGTINRELTIIKRAFKLGERSGAVSYRPYIELLPEAQPRMGFFTEAAFRLILKHTESPELRDILICAYYTGWRIDSVIRMEWRNVDFPRGLIGLTAGQTKNRKATAFPLAPFPELRSVLESRWTLTKECERRKSLRIARVFHRDGKPVKNIRTAWEGARTRAGQPGRILHDLRRSAIRNLKRDGWSDTDVMLMCGLKTLSMLIRYAITVEDDILRQAERLVEARCASKLL
jgi:integrase